MLVKYRMLAGATVADMKADIHKIITGQITSTADFSSSCDKTNTAIYGTYPTAVSYYAENPSTYTYSKRWSQDTNVMYFFKLIWGANGLDQIAVAQDMSFSTYALINSTTSNVWRFAWETGVSTTNGGGAATSAPYDGGRLLTVANGAAYTTAVGDSVRVLGDYVKITDAGTSVYRTIRAERNSITTAMYSATSNTSSSFVMNWDPTVGIAIAGSPNLLGYRSGNVNLTTWTYTSPTYNTVDIVITNYGVFFGSAVNNVALGIFDISKNGISREFTNSSLIALVDLNNTNNGVQIPYFYNVSTSTYGVVSGGGLNYENPVRIPRANANLSIIENPVTTSYRSGGFSVSTIYGLYKIADGTYNNSSRYTDGSGVSRVVYNNFAVVTE
jgi:hypothetical protein